MVGLEMPPIGMHCSALLGVEERIEFANEVLPDALQRVLAGDSEQQLRDWLEDRIGNWGGDGLGMTAPGYSWWRRCEAPDSGLDAEQLACMDRVWETS